MANLRIDKLLLAREAGGTFALTATANLGGGNPTEVNGTLTDRDLVFNTGALNAVDKAIFKFTGLDFSGLSDEGTQHISVFLKDGGAAASRKAGIIIKDTKYPPPSSKKLDHLLEYGVHPNYQTFASQFQIEKLEYTRVGLTGDFNVAADIKFTSDNFNYSKHVLTRHDDGHRSNQLVHRAIVIENAAGALTGTLNFTSDAPLKADNIDGHAIIVTLKQDIEAFDTRIARKLGMIKIVV